MRLWKVAWRSIQQRALSSSLTCLSLALGVALVVAVLVIYSVVNTHFVRGAMGYHLIVGPKGSKQQLVFNTVFHLDQPIENLPYSFYKEFRDGQFASATRLAIPYCLGDSYHAGGHTFRVVGTTPDLFDQLEYGRTAGSAPLKYTFQGKGRNFHADHFFEAVIGSVVAHHSGLKIGDPIRPAHGIVEEGADAHEHESFTVVGILEPTGTPNDRAVFVNIEGFYLLDGHAKEAHEGGHAEASHPEERHAEHDHAEASHDHAHGHHHHHHEPLPESQREVTAVLVLAANDLFAQSIFTMVNEGQVAQAVYPTREMSKFVDTFLRPVQLILLVLTVLIVVVAGVSILVSIYNSMSERRHEIAVMRALGAGRGTVMTVILLESILLALAGGLLGVLLGHSAMALLSPFVAERAGVTIGVLQYDIKELILIPGLVGLAALVGLLPALSAYRTDVARALTANG